VYPHRYSVHSRLGLGEAYLRIWYVEPQANRDLVLCDLGVRERVVSMLPWYSRVLVHLEM
jgi:hypothetical protein